MEDWPDNAIELLNAGPVPPGYNPCYIGCEAKDAEIASDPEVHSIQVLGTECDPLPGPIQGGGIPDGDPKVQTIVESLEQWRESGLYRQVGSCPDDPVNLKKGKLHAGLGLNLYKAIQEDY